MVTKMKKWAVIAFLWLTAAEGAIAFISLFRIPSMERRAWLFGFSALRIGFSLIALIPTGILLLLAIRASTNRTWIEQQIRRITQFLRTNYRQIHLSSVLLFVFILGVFSILFFSSSIVPAESLYKVIFERTKPVIHWISVVAIQGFLLITIGFWEIFHWNLRENRKIFIIDLTIALAVIVALVEWSILNFQWDIFTQIPGWHWQFQLKYGTKTWLFIPLLIVSILLVLIILRNDSLSWKNVLFLIILGYILQVGFGFIEREGIETLRLRYVQRGRPIYSYVVSDDDFSLNTIIEYENNYGKDYFLGRKPPGYLLFHAVTNLVVNPSPLNFDVDERFDRLTTVMAYAYPLISLLVIPIFLALSALFFTKKDAILPSLVLIFSPNFVLLTLQLDQVLFPLLFVLGLYYGLKTMERSSFVLSVILGFYLFIVIYFSFTLLPLLVILPVWHILWFLVFERGRSWKEMALRLLAWSIGFIFAYLVFRYVFHYDVITRFLGTLSANRSNQATPTSVLAQVKAIQLNIAELSVWITFPACLLVTIQVFAIGSAFVQGKPSRLDILLISFGVMCLVIVPFGPSRGEVARLGLFMMPIIALIIAKGIRWLIPKNNNIVIGFITLQMITTLLILKFQFPGQ